jgi:hypothetical protein
MERQLPDKNRESVEAVLERVNSILWEMVDATRMHFYRYHRLLVQPPDHGAQRDE